MFNKLIIRCDNAKVLKEITDKVPLSQFVNINSKIMEIEINYCDDNMAVILVKCSD